MTDTPLSEDKAASLILDGDAYYINGIGWRRKFDDYHYVPIDPEEFKMLEKVAQMLGRNGYYKDPSLTHSGGQDVR